jgi:hypothetical protein
VNKTLKAIIAVILFVAFGESAAQTYTPEVYFRNYSTEHGLASAEVYNAYQDSVGFIWFSTDNGLSRFDSHRFRNFSAGDGLTDNVVFDLVEDFQGNIWANTMSGRLYKVQYDTIIPFKYNHIIKRFKDGRDHHCGTKMTRDGHFYLGMGPKGILHIDPLGVSRIEKPKDKLTIIGEGRSTVYASSENPVNDIIRISEVNYTPEIDRTDGRIPYFIRRFGEHLFVAYDSTMYVYDKEELKAKVQLPHRPVHLGFIDGKFWLGTLHYGAFVSESVEAFIDGSYRRLLTGLSVTDVLRDHEGGYWFTTLERGVFYAPAIDISYLGDKAGLNELSYLAVSMVDEHSYYALGMSRTVYYVNTLEKRFERLPQLPEHYYLADVYFCKDKQRLFVLGRGLFEWKGGRWEMLIGDSKTGDTKGNKRIQPIKGKNRFYFSGKSGFSLYDYETNRMIFSSDEDVVSDWVRAVHRSSDGMVWLGASDGLYMLENNRLNPPRLRDENLNLRVNDIGELPDGRIVLATMGAGVLILDGLLISKITENDGLSGNMISSVRVDAYGRIWAGSMRGLNLIRFTESGPDVRVFGKPDGLPAYEIIDIELDADNVLLATPRGIVLCPQSRFLETQIPAPKIVLSQITIDGQKTEFEEKVEVKPGQSELNIVYHTISFKYPESVAYGYQIEGLSKRWMYTSGPRLFISDMDPGKYKVILQSRNSLGVESASVEIPVVVRVSFWKTWWFYGLVILIASASVLALFVSVLKVLRKGDLTEKRLIQLERSALQAQMNPHFIFNALNSIQSYIATNETDKATHFMAKFSRLIRETLNNSMYSTISLQKELDTIKVYLELEQMRFKSKFDFLITVDDEIKPEKVFIPPMLIQPYLENAIIHGLAQTRSLGRINLYYMLQGDYLVVTVTDNGIGIEASKKSKSAHASFHKSVGMTITGQRLELIDANNKEGKVNVEEIKDRKGEVLGTKVELMIRYSTEELPGRNANGVPYGETGTNETRFE